MEKASQNNLDAILKLAGDADLEKDWDTAHYWYRKAADLGDARAACEVGFSYESGFAVRKDLKQAAYWYKKSANGGYSPAMCSLGKFYAKGEGVPQSDKKAFDWYFRAAISGELEAMTYMGYAFQLGVGTEPNLQKAMSWYQRAADCVQERWKKIKHFELKGTNPEEAFLKWYGGLALWQLGYRAELSEDMLFYFFPKMKAFCKERAEKGDVQCQYLYATACTDTDKKEMLYWLKKAAYGGFPEAQELLANCYEYGHGLPADAYKAVRWYRRAAENGSPEACKRLMQMYFYGFEDVLPEDFLQGSYWVGKYIELKPEETTAIKMLYYNRIFGFH